MPKNLENLSSQRTPGPTLSQQHALKIREYEEKKQSYDHLRSSLSTNPEKSPEATKMYVSLVWLKHDLMEMELRLMEAEKGKVRSYALPLSKTVEDAIEKNKFRRSPLTYLNTCPIDINS